MLDETLTDKSYVVLGELVSEVDIKKNLVYPQDRRRWRAVTGASCAWLRSAQGWLPVQAKLIVIMK
jgi:hypothetical protein